MDCPGVHAQGQVCIYHKYDYSIWVLLGGTFAAEMGRLTTGELNVSAPRANVWRQQNRR